MSSEAQNFEAALDRLIAAASTEYQFLQLAAQHADVEGKSLPGAVLRSISEGQVARAHALLTLRHRLDPASIDAQSFAEFSVEAAVARLGDLEEAGADLSTAGHRLLSSQMAQDLDAALALTSTSKVRLESVLSSLRSDQKAAE